MNKFKFTPGMRKLRARPTQYKLFGFDIETANRNKDFVCGSIVGKDYKKTFMSRQELINEITTNKIFRSSYICATQLTFDFFGVFNKLYEAIKHFNIIERNSATIYATGYISKQSDNNIYTKEQMKEYCRENNISTNLFNKITFIDSLSHYRASVKILGKNINLEKLEKPEYLGQRFPKNQEEMDYMIKYNIRDAEITYKFMEWLQESYNNLGCELKTTISASALDLYKRKFLPQFMKQDKREIIIKLYKAYYGGRTEAFKRGCFSCDNYGKIKVYDVNSLYPAMLRNKRFPYPDSYKKDKITINDIESFEGIAFIKIKSPYINIPIVPLKLGKLLFPIGEISGYYDFETIRYALNLGYELKYIGDGVIYENTWRPFKEFIDKLYKYRLKLKEQNDNRQLIAKILMNGFYGKLGFNYMNKETITHTSNLPDKIEDLDMIPIDENLEFFRVRTTDTSNIPSYVFPIYPIYVTSYGRVHMHKLFKKIGYGNILYTDTDCIFVNKKLNSNNDLGELKLEETFKEVIIVKPKFYSGLTKDREIIKVKGVHGAIKDYNHFKNMVKENEFKVDLVQFRKMRGALLRDSFVNETYQQHKELDLEDTKRKWKKEIFTLKPQKSEPLET